MRALELSRTTAEKPLSREGKIRLLERLEFVRLVGGTVGLGTEKPIVCTVEGFRHNEVPRRQVEIAPFWICRFKVTNDVFEIFNPTHRRVPQSMGDDMPVVDVMYGEALTFCRKLNAATGMNFRLPTEPEWVFAAAPPGWEYPHGMEPDVRAGHVYGDGQEHGAAPVGDPRWKPNWCGLDQMGYNISELTWGHYRITVGQFGAETDGVYCMVKGGNYGHCENSPGVQRRGIFDIADRSTRVGFRLAHGEV